MKRVGLLSHRGVLALAVLVLVVGGTTTLRPGPVLAHPLGNFTINHYSRLELTPGQINLRYVLDMAEIPTFQEMAHIDLDRNGQVSDEERATYLADQTQRLSKGLHLSVNDWVVPLEIVEQELSFPPGQGDLPTLRLSTLWLGQWQETHQSGEQHLYYRNDNYAERTGWREIVLPPQEGVSLTHSTAPERSLSDELTAYPADLLGNPPDLREASASFIVTGEASRASGFQPTRTVPGAESKGEDAFTALIAVDRLNLPVIVVSLVLAVGLGALHAFSPGHGKTITAAYLVGARGTAAHALFLGMTFTAFHTLGVLALALIVLFAGHLVGPEELYPWLGLASGVIIIGIGVWLLMARLRQEQREPHPHSHQHDHSLQRLSDRSGLKSTWKNLVALGMANGLIPSASALLILLAAISLHRIAFGILLLLAFSAGMAVVLSGLGLLLVYASRTVQRLQVQSPMAGKLTELMPLAAALVIMVSGMVVTVRAMFQVGLL